VAVDALNKSGKVEEQKQPLEVLISRLGVQDVEELAKVGLKIQQGFAVQAQSEYQMQRTGKFYLGP
jgi:hypothetical protein